MVLHVHPVTQTPFMSLHLISLPPFCHQILGNGYTQLKISSILSLSPLFISPKYNANVTCKGFQFLEHTMQTSIHQCCRSRLANANLS